MGMVKLYMLLTLESDTHTATMATELPTISITKAA